MESNDRIEGFGALPPLPSMITARDGWAFDPRSDYWTIRSLTYNLNVDFTEFHILSPEIVYKLKLMMTFHLQEKSSCHVRNLTNTFILFYRSVLLGSIDPIEQIEISHILKFKSSLTELTIWKLGVLRIQLTDMHSAGFGIASEEAIEYLCSSTIRGNIKGTSIRTRDPNEGAFSDAELLAMQSSLNNAYARGFIDLYCFTMCWLLLAYGCRSIQIAALKEKDLVVSDTGEAKAYALRIPRAKTRGGGYREEFKTRYCNKQIGALIERVIESNAPLRVECELEVGEAPLFMARTPGHLPDLFYHKTSQSIGALVRNTIVRLTGVKGNAKRFRITLAQRAVDDGKDKYTVAELLDHSDTQNVGVYTEASPAMVLRLDRHLAMEMAPLAQAFAGVVVATEREARRGRDRSSRIYDRTLVDNITEPLGTCGQMSFCGLSAPFACYTCRHFQPWIDGPHEEFMSAMIEDRNRMEAEGMSPKIFTIRDRTILATAEVIQLCSLSMDLKGEV